MKFELLFTNHSDEQMNDLEYAKDKKAAYKAVSKILGFMETNLKHPSLNTHKYDAMQGPTVRMSLRPMLKTELLELTEYFGIMDLVKAKLRYWKSVLIHKNKILQD